MTRSDSEFERMYGVQANKYILGMIAFAQNLDVKIPTMHHAEVAVLLDYAEYGILTENITSVTNNVLDKIIISQ